ncbi:MAG: CBS domain-containing protein [Gemmatimonadetes bacterium]|nr:CBS domain-containing protein [Gemmatimonadota bacterium]
MREAARYMLRTGVHPVLVTEHRRLLGIVSTTDIVRAVAEGRI